MGDIKTPRHAKGSRALKILRKTSQSVYAAKIPPRSIRNVRHSHSLTAARQIKRIDRQPWEERVANILQVVEEHRFGRVNALHHAMDRANQAVQEVAKKKADLEVHSEELQAANEEMRAANEEMRANAEEMRAANEELRAVSEELEREHSDLERFVPLASEKIAQPLDRLAVEIGEMAAAHGDTLDAAAITRLKAVSADAAGMAAIIKGMLDYWRVDLEGKTLETTDCEKILLQVLVKFQDRLQAAGTTLTHDDLPGMVVDSGQFALLLEILLDNAIKHRRAETPQVHIAVEDVAETTVELPEPKIEKGWLLSVSDNGRGIAPRDRERIFMIFEALNGNNGAGMGMGLAMAWRIVKRHGGHIWVESELGKGTTVFFTVPDYSRIDDC